MASAAEVIMPLMYGQVTHIVDPSDFWLRMGSEEELASFTEFEKRLNPVTHHLSTGRIDSDVENCMVLVRCSRPDRSDLTQWKRATVIRVDKEKNTYDVFYMDYGNTEIVSSSRVCPRVPEDIQSYHYNCYRCGLAGIKPIAKSWNTRGIKTFEKLALQHRLMVALVSYNHDTMSHRVTMYKTGPTARSFTHLMLEEETGLPTDEPVKEYAKDVTPVSFVDIYGSDRNLEQDEQCSETPAESSSCEEATSTSEGICQSPVSCSEASSTGSQHQNVALPEQKVDKKTPADTENDVTEKGSACGSDTVTLGFKQSDTVEPEADVTEEEAVSGTEVVIPGFNHFDLQQRVMLTAEELQREQEELQKATRRAMLQKDMIECYHHLENLKMTSGEGQKWGDSDMRILHSAKIQTGNSMNSKDHQTTAVNGGCQEEIVRRNPIDFELETLYPEDKGLKQYQEYLIQGTSEPEVTSSVKEEGKGESPADTFTLACQSVEQTSTVDEVPDNADDSSFSQDQGAAAYQDTDLSVFPPPPKPHPSWTAEEVEYRQHEYVKQVLHEAVQVDWIHSEMLCSHIHNMVPLDADHCELEMKTLMDALLEEAVKDESVRSLALQVLNTYSSVVRGTLFLDVLKHTADKFVKLPVGKMPGFYTEFAQILVQLLFMAFEWPVLLRTVIQDFVLHCLEKWIIFNKRGTQTGLMPRHLEEMYVKCVEIVLPASISILQESNPERTMFIFDQMREKVLETDVDYQIRSDLLTLLLKFGDPYSDSPSPNKEDTNVKKSTHNKGVQVESPLSTQTTGTATEVYSKQDSVSSTDTGSQTDDVLTEGEGEPMERKDADVQTDVVERDVCGRKSSTGSCDFNMASAVNLEGVQAAPGRARRRRALLEHLYRQIQETHGSSAQHAFFSESTGQDHAQLSTPARDMHSLPPSTHPAVDQHILTDQKTAAKESPGSVTTNTDDVNKNVCQGTKSKASLNKKENEECQPLTQNFGKEMSVDEVLQQSQEASASSFFSAVSSMSQSAFKAVFGDRADEKANTSNATASLLVPRSDSYSQMIAQEEEHSVDDLPEENPAEEKDDKCVVSVESDPGNNYKDAGALGSSEKDKSAALTYVCDYDEFSCSDASSDDFNLNFGASQLNTEYGDPENVNGAFSNPLVTEQPWDDGLKEHSDCYFDDVGTHPFYEKGADGIKFTFSKQKNTANKQVSFKSEDFPPLTPKLVTSKPLQSVNAPPTAKVTLDSIAVDFLTSPSSGETLNSTLTENNSQSPNPPKICEELTENTQSSPIKGSLPHCVQGVISGSDVYISEDGDSVPSDWEERLSPMPSDMDTAFQHTGHQVGTGMHGYGDMFTEMGSETHYHAMNPAGDGSSSPSSRPASVHRPSPSLISTSPLITSAQDTPNWSSPPYNEDNGDLLKDSNLSPFTAPFSNSASPGSDVPYQRRDLASLGEDGGRVKPKGRKRFRPFDNMPHIITTPPTADKWKPSRPKCTNCGDETHLRQDCTKIRKSLLL